MNRLNVNDARCEALFVSGLQPSDEPTAAALAELVSAAVGRFGVRGRGVPGGAAGDIPVFRVVRADAFG